MKNEESSGGREATGQTVADAALASVKLVKRVMMKRGNRRRTLVIVAPPFPKRGDILTFQRLDWTVTGVKDEAVIGGFRAEQGKLRQVFP